MEQTSTMTIRLPKIIKNKLERLAAATDRSKAYLAAKAIEDFLAVQEWQIQAIQEAVREAESPQAKFIEHEDFAKKIRSRRTNREGK
jgi:predicted transcriptional regulator